MIYFVFIYILKRMVLIVVLYNDHNKCDITLISIIIEYINDKFN